MNEQADSIQERKLNRIVSKVITGTVIGIAISAGFLLFGDLQKVTAVIDSISIAAIAAALLLICCGYLMRFAKWRYLLQVRQIHMGMKESAHIYFIGLSMGITPGKLGELLKSYILRQYAGIPYPVSIPLVLADRLTDLLAMVILLAAGITLVPYGFFFAVLPILAAIIVWLLLQSRRLAIFCIHAITSLRLLSALRPSLIDTYEGTASLLKPLPLLISTILGLIAWLAECGAFYILLSTLQLDLTALHATFIFAAGSLAGAISMLPGGFGLAEGSITGMLLYFGAEKSVSVSATLLIRLLTLWFGTLLGLAVYAIYRKTYMGKRNVS